MNTSSELAWPQCSQSPWIAAVRAVSVSMSSLAWWAEPSQSMLLSQP